MCQPVEKERKCVEKRKENAVKTRKENVVKKERKCGEKRKENMVKKEKVVVKKVMRGKLDKLQRLHCTSTTHSPI